MKKQLLFLFLSAAAAFTSCTKDGDEPVYPNQTLVTPTPADTTPKINYVLAKTWRVTAFTQGNETTNTHSDLFTSGFPNCQKDDVYTFTSPDALKVSTGNNKCAASETDKTGTWDLNNNSTQFTLNNPAQTITGLNGEFSVVEITASKIELKQEVNGSVYTITFSAI